LSAKRVRFRSGLVSSTALIGWSTKQTTQIEAGPDALRAAQKLPIEARTLLQIASALKLGTTDNATHSYSCAAAALVPLAISLGLAE
jgi:hypothetical protein